MQFIRSDHACLRGPHCTHHGGRRLFGNLRHADRLSGCPFIKINRKSSAESDNDALT